MKGSIILLFIVLNSLSSAQEDSLHLVFTLTGTNAENAIYFCSSLGDINHDNFDDFVIRRKNVNYCEIYYGGKNPNFSKPLKLYDQPNVDMGVLFNIGDINGDGFTDYAESGSLNNGGFPSGIIYVFYGSTEFDTIPDWSLISNCIDGLLGASASGGDINGDGVNDLIIGEPYNWCDGIGRAYLFYGSDSLPGSPDLTFQDNNNSDFYGENVCSNGDINGDGYNDVLIASTNMLGFQESKPRVYVYFGKESISNLADNIIEVNSGEFRVFYLRDFNGDGLTDFYITISNKIYFGSENFTGEDALKFISNEPYDNFGETAGYAGDINNDGFSDLILGATGHKNANGVMVGGAYIYLGSPNPDTTADYFLEGETKWSTFGLNCGTLGDINGDGYDEFYIIAPQYPDTAGTENELGKIYVYSMKKFLVDVNDNDNQMPQKYSLEQNYPNPFNPTTTINYSVRGKGFAQLKIYDVLGKEIATLVNEEKRQGRYSVKFNGTNLPSGVYIYTLRVNNFVQSRKMMLLK